ncbi:C-X-C motif chemokine 10-like [Scyliorhinus canicula]|uniref:C-X-C motif chemokine 10-like n=1 Tax=Scyliorhinus canicula TaxID=7830 RepID=UPI0018F7C2B3|nr:C-X-C motif chemokine 10-like [Scyliorhinus canicula]
MVSKVLLNVLPFIVLCLAFAEAQPRLPNKSRCKCIETINGLHSSMKMSNVKILLKQNFCENVEIIVTLRNGRRTCLNPESEIGKNIINYMESMKRTTKEN